MAAPLSKGTEGIEIVITDELEKVLLATPRYQGGLYPWDQGLLCYSVRYWDTTVTSHKVLWRDTLLANWLSVSFAIWQSTSFPMNLLRVMMGQPTQCVHDYEKHEACWRGVSQPYVDMTVQIMERFGVTVERLNGLQHMRIPPNQTYKTSGEAFVEGDASSASYFLAGATITGGTVVVEGCGSASVQGDVRFAEVSAANRGCLRVTAARALLKQVSCVLY
eukprot:1144916-Pelagomonas_calceolata.AAC.11